MIPLVIYHKSCADGFGAAFAVWCRYGYSAEYYPCQYGEIKTVDDIEKLPNVFGRELIIVDFSFPYEVTERLIEVSDKFTWLDHHKTAFEMWCDAQLESLGERSLYVYKDEGVEIVLDNSRSGAMIAWEHYNVDPAPWLIQHIDDYDRWVFDMSGTKEINKAVWANAPWTFEQWSEWLVLAYQHRPALLKVGEALLKDHNNRVKDGLKGKMRCVIPVNSEVLEGHALNCPPNVSSDSGHILATDNGTYGLLWYLGANGKAKCSLRSNGHYDVSAIAKVFGGGGHMNAAGFEVEVETLLNWLRVEA